MNVNDYVKVSKVALDKNYEHAEKGAGFVVPGLPLIASISPTQPINYIAILHYITNEPRANHYHNHKLEYIVVLDGKLKANFYLPGNNAEQIEKVLLPGDIVEIKPGCVHIFTAIDNEASALEMSPQKLDLSDQINI